MLDKSVARSLKTKVENTLTSTASIVVIILKGLPISKAIKNKNGKSIIAALWKENENRKNNKLFMYFLSAKKFILKSPSPTADAVLAVCISNWMKIGKKIIADKNGSLDFFMDR